MTLLAGTLSSPYESNALVLAPLVPQQLLGEQISILGKQPAQLFLTHTLLRKRVLKRRKKPNKDDILVPKFEL